MLPTSARTLLEEVADGLGREFGDVGSQAATNLQRWTSGDVEDADVEAILELCAAGDLDRVLDEFWQGLPFGTGGRRGPVGFGSNRMNLATVALTIQGHCNYLRARFRDADELSVVVANDVRAFHDIAGRYRHLPGGASSLVGLSSRDMAVAACEIYAGNGIAAYISEPESTTATLTTPELSYAIRFLGAEAGINLSASHNHPDDNGIKVYDHDGSQFAPPEDEALAAHILDPGPASRLDYREASAAGLVRAIPDELGETYRALYLDQFRERCPAGASRTRIVYTPLCGCGERTVRRILEDVGFEVIVPPGQEEDGTFANIPFRAPNPEVEEATVPAKRFADEQGVGLVLSSDPDADRLGVDVLTDSGWVHLTGNEIASVIAYYLMADPDGPGLAGLVIETVVTTKLVAEIARRRPGSEVVDDLLVGFKYVGETLRQREEQGQSLADFVLAAEESHGVLTTPEIRDKDAVGGALYIAYLHAELAKRNLTVHDYYGRIREEIGAHAEAARSIVLRGSAGTREIRNLMGSLRAEPPEVLGGERIHTMLDYWDTDRWGPFRSETDKESRNVVRFESDEVAITVRPSGTEPKLKFYVQVARSDGRADVDDEVRELAAEVYAVLLGRIGRHLSKAALLLPDIIDLAEKENFDAKTLPALRDKIGATPGDRAAVLEWLREAGARLTPGADPVPAMRDMLEAVATEWSEAGEEELSAALTELVREAR